MKGSKSIKERENILQKCTAVFCVSKYIKKQFLDGITEDYKKVHVLYNGVDRKLKTFPSKKKEILFVGRLVFEKGVDLFIDAVKSIAFRFPDWSFVLIGSSKLGENDNVNSYAYQVAKKFKTIDFIDFGSGFKVPYKEGDISTDIEQLGLQLSERFNSFCKDFGKKVTLMFEPGKFLVSKAGYFLAKVNVVKQTTSTVFAGIDSGFNHFIRPMMYLSLIHI